MSFEIGDRVRWRGMEHLGEGRVVKDTGNLTRDGEAGVHFPMAAYDSEYEYHSIPEDELVPAGKGHFKAKVFHVRADGSKVEVDQPEVLDDVNSPAHYNQGKIEVWDFIYDQGLGYALGNATKYVTRAGKKAGNSKVKDLRKAIAFLEREIRFEETGE